MPLASLREALQLLGSKPLLWLPGLVAGILAAALWLLAQSFGIYLATRLLILGALLLMAFIAGMLVTIRDPAGGLKGFVTGATRYYFRVLLPQLVILFMLLVLFFLLAVTFGLLGSAADPGFIGTITFCVMVPTLMLTFFFDIAAVFEDRKVFASIQRSAVLVSGNVLDVIGFYITLAISCFVLLFALTFVWEIALFEKLEPLAEQLQNTTYTSSLTWQDWMTIIGPDGIGVTAVVFFLAGLVFVPFVYSYKACFFKKLSGKSPGGPQVTGEYDSKGRWYKY